MFDLAGALHERRSDLVEAAPGLVRLRDAVASPANLRLGTWFQLFGSTLSYRPSLVLELGRGLGNSTTVFTAAAARLPATRVVSVGYDGRQAWKHKTAPKLRSLVDDRFFECLDVRHADIRDVDFAAVVGDAPRVLLWWDAHGDDLAEFVLGELLPILEEREALVGVHDISDARYDNPTAAYVREDGLPNFWMADLVGPFEELRSLFDFLSRNRIDYATPQRSLGAMRESDKTAWHELDDALGPEAADALRDGGWIYFELDGAAVFPRYTRDVNAPIEGEPTGAVARVRSLAAGVLGR